MKKFRIATLCCQLLNSSRRIHKGKPINTRLFTLATNFKAMSKILGTGSHPTISGKHKVITISNLDLIFEGGLELVHNVRNQLRQRARQLGTHDYCMISVVYYVLTKSVF